MSGLRRRARVAGAVSAVALVALTTACAVGPSQRPPVAVVGGDGMAPPPPPTATTAPPALPRPGPMRPTIRLTDCTADTLAALGNPAQAGGVALRVQCGDIDVPTDPSRRGRGTSRVGVVVTSAADAPRDRPPLLVLGDSATAPSARHGATLATQVSAAVLAGYQVVGLDRRGAGSDLLDCSPEDARLGILDGDTTAPGAATDRVLASVLEDARSVVQDCYLTEPDALTAYSTASTAADVERLREDLGVEQLSAVGIGDGATALTLWASAHPTNVGRLVLDGPPDPAAAEPDVTEARAAGAEQSFDAFAASCAASGSCALGADPRATVTGLLQRLRTQPVAAADGRRLTAGVAVTALFATVGEPRSWPALTSALADADRGVPDAMLALLAPVLGREGRFDSALATACNDTNRRLTPPDVTGLVQRWGGAYPMFGAPLATQLLACAPWPAGAGLPDPGPVPGAPPILALGAAHDPRVGAESVRRAAGALATARLVTWQGTGTGSYPRTPCVAGVVDRMLVQGEMPQADTVCPP
ncbi:alpha/beta hydrolase [Pseudonocardia sp. N23]|uniref:alpha/beta hydrolase n=1 Tax=Pseudonocardia sp. N23 TaxID=1987376 RepID=UPI000BFE79DE|nr:alpha/beta hydrolase [Pseudonocardia sp. N23]GAY10547.1 proteinase, putative [Pseudonocardia sp. N23]